MERVLYVRERILYSIRSLTFSQFGLPNAVQANVHVCNGKLRETDYGRL